MSIKSKDMTMEERRSRVLELVKQFKIGGTLADNILENGVGGYDETILAKYGQEANNLISISASSSDVGLHPTQKPLRLMELLIELVWNNTIKGQCN